MLSEMAGRQNATENNFNFGRSQATNIALAGLYWARSFIDGLNIPSDRIVETGRVIDRVALQTALGQIADNNASHQNITESQARQIATAKTAYYTFELPLRIGAILTGRDEASQNFMSPFAKFTGGIFQAQDDLGGVLGDSAASGKIPNDLQEGKQTVPIIHAYKTATDDERRILDRAKTDPEWLPRAQQIIGCRSLKCCQNIIASDADAAHQALRLANPFWPTDYVERLHGLVDHLAEPAEFAV
jgi:geranylgeranyl pyrophosphate synthase